MGQPRALPDYQEMSEEDAIASFRESALKINAQIQRLTGAPVGEAAPIEEGQGLDTPPMDESVAQAQSISDRRRQASVNQLRGQIAQFGSPPSESV